MSIVSGLKKIFRGEPVIVLKRPQSHWDRQFSQGKWQESEEMGQNVGVVVRMVLEEALERPIRVLDVGCGSGVLGQYIANTPNVTYVGTDLSESALTLARQRVPQGTFHQADMETGPKFEGTFDVIVFAEVLLYGNYVEVLKLHEKYLNENGWYIISLYQTWRTRYIWYKLSHYVRVYKDISVRDVTRNIGWRVCKCRILK